MMVPKMTCSKPTPTCITPKMAWTMPRIKETRLPKKIPMELKPPWSRFRNVPRMKPSSPDRTFCQSHCRSCPVSWTIGHTPRNAVPSWPSS